MREIWKDIKDYEGLYQVSNWGRVKSLGNGGTHKTSRILKSADARGYLQVELSKNGKTKKFSIHRLVAEAFLPNPLNLPQINHKDENPSNNNVSNLEWCDCKYNINYGSRNKKVAKVNSKPVLQFSKSGSFIREWPSAKECGRNGFDFRNVSACCLGKRKTYKGYIWKYKETL